MVRERKIIHRQHGLAIITVLLIVALMVTLLAFLSEQQHLLIRRIGNQNIVEKGYQYGLGVNAWAQRVLHQDQNREVDYWDEDWAKFGKPPEENEDGFEAFSLTPSSEQEEEELPVVDFGNEAELTFEIVDLQSRFNLNNLANPDDGFLLEQKIIFINLLELAGVQELDLRERLYGALKDWLDQGELISANGAESPTYQAKESSYFASDQKLVSVAELRYVEGYTQDIINLISPYVVALPIDVARININTVSPEVLASLSSTPVIELGSVQDFLSRRENPNFLGFVDADIEMAKTAVSGVFPVPRQPIQNMMQTNSQFFQVNTEVSLGDFDFCMKTVMLRENADPDSRSSPRVRVINRQHNSFGLCQD